MIKVADANVAIPPDFQLPMPRTAPRALLAKSTVILVEFPVGILVAAPTAILVTLRLGSLTVRLDFPMVLLDTLAGLLAILTVLVFLATLVSLMAPAFLTAPVYQTDSLKTLQTLEPATLLEPPRQLSSSPFTLLVRSSPPVLLLAVWNPKILLPSP